MTTLEFCPRCGTKRTPGMAFCSGCGLNLADLPTAANEQPATEQPASEQPATEPEPLQPKAEDEPAPMVEEVPSPAPGPAASEAMRPASPVVEGVMAVEALSGYLFMLRGEAESAELVRLNAVSGATEKRLPLPDARFLAATADHVIVTIGHAPADRVTIYDVDLNSDQSIDTPRTIDSVIGTPSAAWWLEMDREVTMGAGEGMIFSGPPVMVRTMTVARLRPGQTEAKGWNLGEDWFWIAPDRPRSGYLGPGGPGSDGAVVLLSGAEPQLIGGPKLLQRLVRIGGNDNVVTDERRQPPWYQSLHEHAGLVFIATDGGLAVGDKPVSSSAGTWFATPHGMYAEWTDAGTLKLGVATGDAVTGIHEEAGAVPFLFAGDAKPHRRNPVAWDREGVWLAITTAGGTGRLIRHVPASGAVSIVELPVPGYPVSTDGGRLFVLTADGNLVAVDPG